jgi:MFS family permease
VVTDRVFRAGSRALWRNLALDLIAAIGVGSTMALVSSLLPTVARRGGLEPLGLAALAAAPFLANLLGVFAGRVGARTPRQLGVLRASGAGLLLILVVWPFAPVMVLVAVGFWLSLSFGGPYHLRLWGSMYPARSRGRVVGALGMGRATSAAGAALVAGLVADSVGGLVAVAAVGLLGVVCSAAYLGLRSPAAAEPPRYSARESIRALRDRPILRRIVLAQGFYGGGLIAAVPLYALVHVDRLGLSLGQVGSLGIVSAVATTASYVGWGAVSDRRGAMLVLRCGGLLGLGSLLAYALAPSVAVLYGAALLGGFASAAIDLGIATSVSAQTTLESRAAAMAGWNALTGARGLVAPFLMSGLVQAGVLDVTSGLLVCSVVTGLGAAIYLGVGSPEGAGHVRLPAALRDMRAGRGVRAFRRGTVADG